MYDILDIFRVFGNGPESRPENIFVVYKYARVYVNMIKAILFGLVVNSASAFNASECRDDHHETWFCDYMEEHDRTYDQREVPIRKNKLMNKRHVEERDGVIFGLTSRSDRFRHELKTNAHLKLTKHLGVKRAVEDEHVHLAAPLHLKPIDWRNVNGRSYITPVKDQGDCGGCFAFAAATVLEYWSRREGEPKSLSPQSLMDCPSRPSEPNNDGCEGGLMEYVFEYAKHHSVPLEVDVPYKERDDTCSKNTLWSRVAVKGYKVLMHADNRRAEGELEALIHAYGPVSVGIDSTTMEDYKGGIFRANMCSRDIDHAVTVVGYTENAWIVKNSWGTNWGEDGYLFLERGKNACGVAEYVVYVTDAKPTSEKMET